MNEIDEVKAFEKKLSAALREQADAIEPSDRLAAIKAAGGAAESTETTKGPEKSRAKVRAIDEGRKAAAAREDRGDSARTSFGGRRPYRWFAVAAGLILVLGVGGVILPRLFGGSATSSAAGNADAAKPEARASAAAAPATAAGPERSSATTQFGTQGLAIYYVNQATPNVPWLLARDVVPLAVLPSDTPAQAAVTALVSWSYQGRRLPSYSGVQQPWRPNTTARVTVADEIKIELNQPGIPGLAEDQQRVAIQSLVWTATAAAGANLPVRITVATGAQPFESKSAGVYQRPPEDQAYQDLSPIWVTSPTRWTPVAASQPVVVTGEGCTYEGGFAWELQQGGQPIRSGRGNSGVGCPVRAQYSLDLGVLAPGAYTIRVYVRSGISGSVVGQSEVPFTVA